MESLKGLIITWSTKQMNLASKFPNCCEWPNKHPGCLFKSKSYSVGACSTGRLLKKVKMTKEVLQCAPTAKVWGSWNSGFLGEVKIFLISSGVLIYEVGEIFLRGRPIHFPSFFPFGNARFQKFKHFCLRRPHFQYSHFQI